MDSLEEAQVRQAPTVTSEPRGVKRELVEGVAGAIGNAMTTKEKMAARSRFYRSLEPAAVRKTKAQKISPSLAAKIGSDGRGKAFWFQQYLNSGEDWDKLELAFMDIERSQRQHSAKRQWCTEHRLLDLFKSETVVQAMMRHAMANPEQFRENPNCPGVREAGEYYRPPASEKKTRNPASY